MDEKRIAMLRARVFGWARKRDTAMRHNRFSAFELTRKIEETKEEIRRLLRGGDK